MDDRAAGNDDPTRTGAGDRTLTDASPRPGERARPAPHLREVDPSSYELGDEIAHGGMGRIRLARDLRLGREVAIKELLVPGDQRAARFEREALVTARLQHPAIVAVYEAGRWPSGEPFYAMKLVHGRSLKTVIADTSSLDARLALLPHAIAVADAMAYAHDQRIVHRDLKPSNVLVGAFGETVVIDWGLAKDLAASADDPEPAPAAERSSDASLTRVGSVMGTPNYMAPEQARGEPVDERADVYALGAMLYHLLCGVPPYLGSDSAAVVAKVASEPPLPLGQREPALAPDLLAIVERAMARDRSARYPTARGLADDLRRFQTGQLVASHHYTRAALIRRFARKHRVPLAVGGAGAVVLAVVGAIAVHGIRSERDAADRQRDVAEQQRATALDRADRLAIAEARQLVVDDPAAALGVLGELSPHSSLLPAARVIAADARARGIPRIVHIDHAHDFTAMVVSADGTLIATATDGGTLQVWNAATLETRIVGHHDRYAYVHAIDHARLITSSYDNTVRIWDLARGTETIVLPHPGPVRMVAISDDGRVIVTSCDDRVVRAWDVATRRVTREFDYRGSMNAIAIARDGQTAVYQVTDQPPHVLELATGTDRVPDPAPARGFALAPDGATLVIAAADGGLVVVETHGTGRRVLGHVDRDPIAALELSPDGATIATVSDVAHDIVLWPTAGGPSRALATADDVGLPRFSPDGHALIVSGRHPTLWDLDSGQATPLLARTNVEYLAFALGGASVVGATGDELYAWPARGDARVIARVTAPARQVEVLGDGRLLIAGGDGALRVGDIPRAIDGGLAGRFAIAPRGTSIAMLGTDDRVRIVDLGAGVVRVLDGTFRVGHRGAPADPQSRSLVPSKEGLIDSSMIRRQSRWVREQRDWVGHAVFAPDGATLAAYPAEGGELALWTLASGVHRVVTTGEADLEQLGFAPDGRTLFAASSDGRLFSVDISTGAVHALDGHAGPIEDLAISADGHTLASASADHTVRLWDVATGTSRVVCIHGGAVGRVAFVPDQSRVVSAGDDGVICVWDLRSGSSRLIDAHTAPIVDLAISHDGRTLATAADDGTVRIADLATGETRELTVSGAVVGDLAFTLDDHHVVGAVSDGTVREWPDDLPRDETALRSWIAAALR
jgi:WD40 repeat protein